MKTKLLPLLILILVVCTAKVRDQLKSQHLFQDPSRLNEMGKGPDFQFKERAAELNIRHRHLLYTPSDKRSSFSQLVPYNASVAVADINNDGFYDLFFSNARQGQSSYLYLNQAGNRFTDVTELWGLSSDQNDPGPTMSGYFFDFNNDGFQDLLLIKAGCHKIFKNTGNRFVDVSSETKIDQFCSYGSSAAMLDFDGDGFTDIYIANSLNAESDKMRSPLELGGAQMKRRDEHFRMYRRDFLLKNNGGKVFSDVTEELKIDNNWMTWAVGVLDLGDDGDPDLYLANDFSIGRILVNDSGKRFTDQTQILGHQYYSGNMSGTVGDFNNDLKMDIFVSNLSQAKYYVRMQNFLYEQNQDVTFKNKSSQLGVDRCGFAWGSNFFDADRDGFLDLFVTNGLFDGGESDFQYKMETYYVTPTLVLSEPRNFPSTKGHSLRGRDRSCMFWQKDGQFYDVANLVGMDQPFVGRGSVVIDFDNDGELDIVVAAHNDYPKLYKNSVQNNYGWVGLSLSSESNRSLLGTKVILETDDGQKQMRELYPTNGFSSQSDPRLFFGLKDKKVSSIKIIWPDRTIEIKKDLGNNQYNAIVWRDFNGQNKN